MNMKLIETTTPVGNPLAFGALLPNGATIIDWNYFAFDERADGVYKHGRVLALRIDSPDPFVTWWFTVHPNQDILTHGGHYYSVLKDAVEDLA